MDRPAAGSLSGAGGRREALASRAPARYPPPGRPGGPSAREPELLCVGERKTNCDVPHRGTVHVRRFRQLPNQWMRSSDAWQDSNPLFPQGRRHTLWNILAHRREDRSHTQAQRPCRTYHTRFFRYAHGKKVANSPPRQKSSPWASPQAAFRMAVCHMSKSSRPKSSSPRPSGFSSSGSGSGAAGTNSVRYASSGSPASTAGRFRIMPSML